MSIDLQDFANADISYISKLNANNAAIESAVGAIQDQLGGVAGSAFNLGPPLAAIFGPDTARINEGSLDAQISGQTVVLGDGFAWIASTSQIVSSAGGTVDLTGLSDNTYYIVSDSLGTLTHSVSSTDALWSVDKAGTSLSNLTAVAGIVDGYRHPFPIPAFFAGVPGASALIHMMVATEAIELPDDLPGSYAKAGTAATGSTTFTIKKNGSSIGTFNFGAGQTVATFTFSSADSLAPGDILTIHAPGSADATLANIAVAIRGIR